MSYSFSYRAANKAAAIVALAAKFDEVVASQPVHEADRAQAQAAAEAFIAVLPDDTDKDVAVTVNGWLSWSNPPSEAPHFTAASFSVTASLVAKA